MTGTVMGGEESKNVGNWCDVIYGWSLSRNQAVGAEQATYSLCLWDKGAATFQVETFEA